MNLDVEAIEKLFRRQYPLPVQAQGVAANDRRALAQGEADVVLPECLGEPDVHLVIRQPHRSCGDARRPFPDFDAVESVDVDQRQVWHGDVLLLAAMERLEDLDFKKPQFAVRNDEEVAAAAGRIKDQKVCFSAVSLFALAHSRESGSRCDGFRSRRRAWRIRQDD